MIDINIEELVKELEKEQHAIIQRLQGIPITSTLDQLESEAGETDNNPVGGRRRSQRKKVGYMQWYTPKRIYARGQIQRDACEGIHAKGYMHP